MTKKQINQWDVQPPGSGNGVRIVTVSSWEDATVTLAQTAAEICILDISDKTMKPPEEDAQISVISSRVILVADSYDEHARAWLQKVMPAAILIRPFSEEQLAALSESVSLAAGKPSITPSWRYVNQAMGVVMDCSGMHQRASF